MNTTASPDKDAPLWYTESLSASSESGTVYVAGASITYRVWGEVGLPGVILIHGSNAHLEWWRFFAPLLADQFRVAAIDLSGHGNSDWRERYTGDLMADEVWAVCTAAALGPKPFVVGHSFGGFVALETGHRFDQHLGGVLFMDFTVAPREEYMEWGLRVEREGVKPGRKLRVYEDKETALGRFRLLPDQPGVYPPLLSHMAEYGLREVEGGWTWKFDPTLFDYMEMGADQFDKFMGITAPTAVILGERSEDEGALFANAMLAAKDGLLPTVTIPGTYHHLMFDEPVGLATATKLLLLEWRRQHAR